MGAVYRVYVWIEYNLHGYLMNGVLMTGLLYALVCTFPAEVERRKPPAPAYSFQVEMVIGGARGQ